MFAGTSRTSGALIAQPATACRESTAVLFCVGAQKVGTTWLYEFLRRHPDCHVPTPKEMHYFDVLHAGQTGFRDARAAALAAREAGMVGRLRAFGADVASSWGRGLPTRRLRALVEMHTGPDPGHGRYWAALTEDWTGGRLVADVTPDYCTLDAAGFRDMARNFPQARFLFVMRDPVTRLWSALRQQSRHLRDTGRGEVPPAVLAERYIAGELRQIRLRSDYARTVAALDAAVPEHRRLYLFSEDLFAGPGLVRLTEFLGLAHRAPPSAIPGRAPDAVLPEALRARLRSDLDDAYRAMRARFGNEIPAAWSAHDALVGV